MQQLISAGCASWNRCLLEVKTGEVKAMVNLEKMKTDITAEITIMP